MGCVAPPRTAAGPTPDRGLRPSATWMRFTEQEKRRRGNESLWRNLLRILCLGTFVSLPHAHHRLALSLGPLALACPDAKHLGAGTWRPARIRFSAHRGVQSADGKRFSRSGLALSSSRLHKLRRLPRPPASTLTPPPPATAHTVRGAVGGFSFPGQGPAYPRGRGKVRFRRVPGFLGR